MLYFGVWTPNSLFNEVMVSELIGDIVLVSPLAANVAFSLSTHCRESICLENNTITANINVKLFRLNVFQTTNNSSATTNIKIFMNQVVYCSYLKALLD
jgi:hypothetical protein